MSLLQWSYPDDLTRHLSALLLAHAHHPDVEIEGKLGRIVGSHSHSHGHAATRPHFPPLAASQTLLLDADSPVKSHAFDATIPKPLFARLTDVLLKTRVENEAHAAHAAKRAPRLVYSHPVIFDYFFANGLDKEPIRVSRRLAASESGGKNNGHGHGNEQLLTVVVKKKLAHMDVLMPPIGPLLPELSFADEQLKANSSSSSSSAAAAMHKLPPIDYRITVAREMAVNAPPAHSEPHLIRKKDRRCYELLNEYRIDCTIVETWYQNKKQIVRSSPTAPSAAASTSASASSAASLAASTAASTEPLGLTDWVGVGKGEISYEVELEMTAPLIRRVHEERLKFQQGKESSLLELSRSCLDNCRSLARAILESNIPASCLPVQKHSSASASSLPQAALASNASILSNGAAESASRKRLREDDALASSSTAAQGGG